MTRDHLDLLVTGELVGPKGLLGWMELMVVLVRLVVMVLMEIQALKVPLDPR